MVVASYGHFDVSLVDQHIVGRVKPDPAQQGQPDIQPGVRGTVCRGVGAAVKEVAADIAAGNPQVVAHKGQHDMGIVLADPTPVLKRFVDGGVDVGAARVVGDRPVQSVVQRHQQLQWIFVPCHLQLVGQLLQLLGRCGIVAGRDPITVLAAGSVDSFPAVVRQPGRQPRTGQDQHLGFGHNGQLLMDTGLGKVMDRVLLFVVVGEQTGLGADLETKLAALLIVGVAWLHSHFCHTLDDRAGILVPCGMAN